MEDREQVLRRLRELKSLHDDSTVGVSPDAPRFMEDEMVTRESYHLVFRDAVSSGLLSADELTMEGLPDELG